MKQGYEKYIPFKQVNLPNRQWPNRVIDKAPVWCASICATATRHVNPMNMEEKLTFFKTLCDMGFKEIEIGFPSANETEYEICRELIEKNLIPDDVWIQVLVQARPHLIRRTFEAIRGAKNVIPCTFTTPPLPSSARWYFARTAPALPILRSRAPASSAS